MKIDTIRYWHKLEHFYPYILEEQRDKNIKTYSVKVESDFPDYKNQDIPEDKRVRYYEIYLGIFKVDSALKVLAEKMHAEKEFHDESDETSCFCKIRVNEDGGFDKEKFKISSFPWAVQRVQDNEIYMEKWDEDFQSFEREFFLRFFNCHEILTYDVLRNIMEELKKSIGWNIEFETCWMRVDRVIGDKIGVRDSKNADSDENENKKSKTEIQLEDKRVDELIKANDLLNSFYVRDLERVLEQIKEKNYGMALDRFVEHNKSERIDIEKDKEALLEIFNPKNMPLGKWPSGYGLRAMQQVSVNLALSNRCIDNVFSVNGPPGTGKTTLLRDIIAAKQVERAIKLLELKQPDDAFMEPIGTVNDNGFVLNVNPLKPELREYGIFVASNNNSAVKNISEELPLKSSLSEKYRNSYGYFSEVSDRLLKNETWGVLAAALGNYKNKTNFIDNFWPVFEKEEDKFNFKSYLKETQDEKTSLDIISDWEGAKEQFRKVYVEIQNVYGDMENCYANILRVKELKGLIKSTEDDRGGLINELEEKIEELNSLHRQIDENETTISRYEKIREEIKRNTTLFWLKYILGISIAGYKQMERDIQSMVLQKADLFIRLDKTQSEYDKRCAQKETLENEIVGLKREEAEIKIYIEEWRKRYQGKIPDEEYLSSLVDEVGTDRDIAQNTSPWNAPKIIELREKLFLEAVNLHRAFVENSKVLYWQLELFYKLIKGKLSKDDATKYATSIIQSFQVAVPVMSSTFASVGTFLKYAGRSTFGLLLIDEAGQALPQSAIGSIWRSDKCVIVGDPLQIEPVVTIHDKTIAFLQLYFKQSDFIASKETSVQSLADECNAFGGWRVLNGEKMWIGSPLLVHGRCQRTIFDISNIIAYNKKMIYGTNDKEGAECKWLHVEGKAINKHYVREQAEAILPQVVDAFFNALEEGKVTPSLFIITPFRSVKAGLIRYFSEYDFLYRQIYESEDEELKFKMKEWIYKSIGTIHTFQGKEAEKVIIVLGVDSGDGGYGAIQWASQKPNILNVAVTRAKTQLCIVGDKNKWRNQPNFDVAYRLCEK